MATQNATITASWLKLADANDDPVMIQSTGFIEYQVAAMATETTPTVQGHTISGRDYAISRATLGEGHIYARLIAGGESETLVVTGSSETLS
jgi:hypothetical protein